MELVKQENYQTEADVAPPHIVSSKRILGAALFLGAVANLLFYDKAPGLSVLLFTLLLLVALWSVGRSEKQYPIWRNSWLLAPLLFFGAMVAVRANLFLTVLNILALLSILSFIVFFYAAGRVDGFGLLATAVIPVRVVGNSISNGVPVFAARVSNIAKHEKASQRLIPVLRGGLLALPILILFTLLLTSADLIFAGYVDDALSVHYLSDIAEWFWRGALIGLTAVFLGGALMYTFSRRDGKGELSWLETAVNVIPREVPLGITETMVVLILVNGLFLMFTAVQFVYLFGGADNIHLQGHTYAEYARRGFFEMITVAILSLGLILGLNWLTRRNNKRQIKLFNGFATVLIIFVAAILLSAWQRMRLYEANFGYTELRLYVTIFILWLIPLLIWFVLTLWKQPDFFAIGVIVTAIGFLVTLNLLNPDALIARRNLARYQQTGDLDIFYLTNLSDDAVPELIAALPLLDGDEQTVCSWIDPYGMERVISEECAEVTMAEVLDGEINGRLQSMTDNPEWRRWQSFNLSHWQAWTAMRNGL